MGMCVIKRFKARIPGRLKTLGPFTRADTTRKIVKFRKFFKIHIYHLPLLLTRRRPKTRIHNVYPSGDTLENEIDMQDENRSTCILSLSDDNGVAIWRRYVAHKRGSAPEEHIRESYSRLEMLKGERLL